LSWYRWNQMIPTDISCFRENEFGSTVPCKTRKKSTFDLIVRFASYEKPHFTRLNPELMVSSLIPVSVPMNPN
jgi:hypothetical protein